MLAARQGIEWMATDEGVLGRSLDFNFARDGGEHLSADGAERLYNIYRYEKGDTRMHMVFRDHRLSDLIGFVYSGMPAQDAANHLSENIKNSARACPGTRQGRRGFHHPRRRKRLGVLPAIGPRISAALLRCPAERSGD